ncbi:MAG TPA: cytochrome C [Casimicrobiaceae bacterium]|nr:cytochrome C [Casimicrobiaceae bacterium]
MKTSALGFAMAAIGLLAAQTVIAADAPAAQRAATGSAQQKQLERGRYVVMIGGCNDCHTDNYAPSGGQVPQSEWLKGSGPLGFAGPWGTTYAPNLRIVVARYNEAEWVKYAKTLKTRPPMPWFNVNAMSESDLRAMYRFVKSLGPGGDAGPAYLPAGQQPPLPVVEWRLGPKN